jgi:hypothetical protein
MPDKKPKPKKPLKETIKDVISGPGIILLGTDPDPLNPDGLGWEPVSGEGSTWNSPG